MNGVWKAPDTCSGMTFLAPSSLAWTEAAATPDGDPAITTWPGALKLATHTSASARRARDLDMVVVEAEHRSHRAGLGEPGVVHRGAALGDESHAVVEPECAGRGECGVLAEAVAGAVARLDAETFDRVEDHQARHERRQLGVAGVLEFVGVGVAQQGADIALRDVARLVDEFPALVVTPGKSHAGALRALAGEGESEHWPQARPLTAATRATAR